MRLRGSSTRRLSAPPWPPPRRSSASSSTRTTWPRPAGTACPWSRSSGAPTSASRRSSTGSSAVVRRSSRTCPGVTRDRVTYDAEWTGRRFVLVDTGGWDPDARGWRRRSPSRPSAPWRSPTSSSSWSTRRSGPPTPTRPSSRCCGARASPSCSPPTRSTTSAPRPTRRCCGRSGSGEPYAVSALHGRGSGDLLDAVLEVLPEQGSGRSHDTRPPSRRAGRQAERRQVLAAQQARGAGAGCGVRGRRHDRRPRRRDRGPA